MLNIECLVSTALKGPWCYTVLQFMTTAGVNSINFEDRNKTKKRVGDN